MNNKKIGTQFEQEFCNLLAQHGYWVHFITPDRTGSQPFDVIAVRDGKAPFKDLVSIYKYTLYIITRLSGNVKTF